MKYYENALRALLAYQAELSTRTPTDEDIKRAAELTTIAQQAYARCYDRASRENVESLRFAKWPANHGDVQ